MTPKARLLSSLNHKQPDRVCVDFGSTLVTGIAASTVSKLRKAVLGEGDYRVKVIEPYQMLGEVDEKLREALGVDVVGVIPPVTMFGFENKDWKPFTLFDGTDVLVPGEFNVKPTRDGGWYIYPEGDTSAKASGRMPKDGFYFDAIPRQEPIEEDKLDPKDNLEEFGPVSDRLLESFKQQAEYANANSLGAVVSTPGTGFGDIALVPAMWMKRTKGIRDIEEWYVSTVTRRDYVLNIFKEQCRIALGNLPKIAKAVGDKAQAAFVTGTDFGMQTGLFISKASYRDLFKPFHKAVNDYIHENTNWKTFIHTCGSVIELIPDLIDAGFDILNPVQCTAANMDPRELKRQFGNDIVFWGGGVDTQTTLPFGTPDQVYKQVRERIEIFNEGGGFVFNAIHNVQASIGIDNVLAMFNALRDSRQS